MCDLKVRPLRRRVGLHHPLQLTGLSIKRLTKGILDVPSLSHGQTAHGERLLFRHTIPSTHRLLHDVDRHLTDRIPPPAPIYYVYYHKVYGLPSILNAGPGY